MVNWKCLAVRALPPAGLEQPPGVLVHVRLLSISPGAMAVIVENGSPPMIILYYVSHSNVRFSWLGAS